MTILLISFSAVIILVAALIIAYNEGYSDGHTDALDLASDDLTEVHIACVTIPTHGTTVIGVHTTPEGAIAERDANKNANMYNVSRNTSWHVISKPLIKD